VATIRFLSPVVPDLALTGVPAVFVDGVFDINDQETDRISRLRYLGTPYGVIEMGAVSASDSATGVTMAQIAQAMGDPTSTVGRALAASAPSSTQVNALSNDVDQLQSQVNGLIDNGGGSRVVYGTSVDATDLSDGTLVVVLSADPTA
jgi:hypothetical protein